MGEELKCIVFTGSSLCKTALCGLCIPWQCSCVGKEWIQGRRAAPKWGARLQGSEGLATFRHIKILPDPGGSRLLHSATWSWLSWRWRQPCCLRTGWAGYSPARAGNQGVFCGAGCLHHTGLWGALQAGQDGFVPLCFWWSACYRTAG